MILAANVLHATKDIDNTLKMVRKLLKPNGKLILFGVTNTSVLRSNFSFGLLPGWWLSDEPHRLLGAALSTKDWNKHLEKKWI